MSADDDDVVLDEESEEGGMDEFGDDDFEPEAISLSDEGDIGDEDEDEDAIERVAPVKIRAKVVQTFFGVPRSKLDDAKVAGDTWSKHNTPANQAQAKPYSVKGVFAPNEVIDHKVFGLGFVMTSTGGQKLEALFQSGVKKLVQGR